MATQAHLNKAAKKRRSSRRARRDIGVELMILALSHRFGTPFGDDSHMRLYHLAFELGARDMDVPVEVARQLAAANPFARGYLGRHLDEVGDARAAELAAEQALDAGSAAPELAQADQAELTPPRRQAGAELAASLEAAGAPLLPEGRNLCIGDDGNTCPIVLFPSDGGGHHVD